MATCWKNFVIEIKRLFTWHLSEIALYLVMYTIQLQLYSALMVKVETVL